MKKMTALVAVACAAWSIGASADGIGVVDMKMIFTTSPKVKAIKANLTKQFDPEKAKLEKMGNTLQADIAKYQKNKAVMSKDDMKKAQDSITAEESAFRDAQTKFQQDVFNAQNKSLETFMGDVKAAVKVVADKQKLDLVIPNNDVLFSKGDKDITKEVLENLK
ncbi:MAG: OmpH family outer membrane protein [Coxiellaceae bacterium]|nr:OmpH family outer membrane protein [Coxiellaceae bacterium]